MDRIKHNLTEKGILGEEAQDGCLEAISPKHRPHKKWKKMLMKKK